MQPMLLGAKLLGTSHIIGSFLHDQCSLCQLRLSNLSPKLQNSAFFFFFLQFNNELKGVHVKALCGATHTRGPPQCFCFTGSFVVFLHFRHKRWYRIINNENSIMKSNGFIKALPSGA